MKQIKTKLVLAIISLVTSVFLVAGVSYAWYVSNNTVNDMNFQILQIDSQINMYLGSDINNNGIVDLLKNEYYGMYKDANEESQSIGYIAYEKAYYEEKREFALVDSKYALSLQSSANLLNSIHLKNITPSKVYTLKFEVTNYSSFENTISFEFMNGLYPQDLLAHFAMFDIRFGVVNNSGEVNYSTPYRPFIEEENGSYSYEGLVLSDDIVVSPTGPKAADGRIDIWVQMKVKNEIEYSEIIYHNIEFPTFKINLLATVEKHLATAFAPKVIITLFGLYFFNYFNITFLRI